MTNEEMIAELKSQGYVIKEPSGRLFKLKLLRLEADKLGMPNLFVTKEILDAFYIAADYATGNYTKKKTKSGWYANCRNQFVREDMEDEYKRILRGFLEVMKPYYNKIQGFCSKGTVIKND